MFKPFNKINRKTFLILVGSQALVTLLLWQCWGGGGAVGSGADS